MKLWSFQTVRKDDAGLSTVEQIGVVAADTAGEALSLALEHTHAALTLTGLHLHAGPVVTWKRNLALESPIDQAGWRDLQPSTATKVDARATGEKMRELLLSIPEGYEGGETRRSAALSAMDLCRDCGDDLRRPDGTTRFCHCMNDE